MNPNGRARQVILPRCGVLGLSLACFWLGIRSQPAAATQQDVKPLPDQVAFFENKIRPILADNCFVCHSKGTKSGGLSLDSREAILKGGGSGAAIVPGDPDKSLIIKSVRQSGALKMPAGGKLKPSEVADLESWVKMGAPWPTSSGSTEKKPLWSLQPVRRPDIPKVKNPKLIGNPIDAFVEDKLEKAKFTLGLQADKRTLLRRVTYDLVGLPPTQDEMAAFLADKSPDAYDKVVDRLLASPHYGERWARAWLDVARYADTKGYVFEEDRNYYNAYTYRDWVINAFNQDLPYDQFITQQLAADRLPEVQNGDDKRPLAALGFLNIGRRFLNSQPDIIDDRIDVTMRGFEGFTVECARCHDHKFDPIPTQDYYSLYAVFNSSQEKEAPISDKPIRDPWLQYSVKVSQVQDGIKQLVNGEVKKLREKLKDPAQAANIGEPVKETLQSIRPDQTPDASKLAKIRSAFQPDQRGKLSQLEEEAQTLSKTAPTKPEFAMAMEDRPHPADGYVFKRGNPGNHGDPAPRRFLAALSPPGVERTHWTNDSGRLELAQSIASKDNPLTARVFVNRMWQSHFGAGIVRTPSDFGNQGEKPTHPELLDYLATTFMDGGWSIKKLQRLIVTSNTYKQTSDYSPQLYNADPENRYLGRMMRHRLDLEQMRDTFLMVSGKLDLKDIGGKSVDLWTAPFTPRRGVYGFVERQNLPGIFRTFDFASPDSTSARRFQTTVPQQALFFMNSPLSVQSAQEIAKRPEILGASDEAQRIRRLYLLLFDRLPSSAEASVGAGYLKNQDFEAMSSAEGVWSYGFGGYDTSTRQTSGFSPFPILDAKGYHFSANFPDAVAGYLCLTSNGGHPGRDTNHAAIRRWTAPENMTIDIQANLVHRQPQGDGVRGRIVSSRQGLLGEWVAHNSVQKADLTSVTVQKGETIDFAVDPIASDAYDSFEWNPIIRAENIGTMWSAQAGFGPKQEPLNRLTTYVQALMMTNEFMFVD